MSDRLRRLQAASAPFAKLATDFYDYDDDVIVRVECRVWELRAILDARNMSFEEAEDAE